MIGSAELSPKAIEPVASDWQCDRRRDLKRSRQQFELRLKRQAEAVTRVEFQARWRPKKIPRLSLPARVGDVMILVVKKGLANPAQTPIPIGAGFHPAGSVELSYARPREKAQT